jgi:hypothetical protein
MPPLSEEIASLQIDVPDQPSPAPTSYFSGSPSKTAAEGKEQELFGRRLSADDQTYLKDLSLYSMTRLQREPQELKREREKLQADIENIAVTNYRSFIDTSQALTAAHRSIVKMDDRLRDLVDHMPDFNRKCEDFVQHSEHIQAEQQLNRVMLDKEQELLELLEIPNLMVILIIHTACLNYVHDIANDI